MNSFNSSGISYPLYDWQSEAIEKWEQNGNRGIVQATTGSGKSRVAHAIIVEHLRKPDGVVTVLVPQVSLLRQWADALDDVLGFKVGRCGGGKKDISEKINVMVINTALKILPLKTYNNHLIVADECHRMAAPSFQRVFDNLYHKSLGLSATPEREDSGLEVLTDLIGDIVYEYGYEDALEAGVISDFKVCAVQIPLNPSEASNKSSTRLGSIGVALNGVAIYIQYAGPNNQPLTGEINSFDQYNGHPQPQGVYHYHMEPLYLTENQGNDALLGFLLDGFPVYGPFENMAKVTNEDLDDYHGHNHATDDFPSGIYHYHITENDPYINGNGYFGTPGTVTQ